MSFTQLHTRTHTYTNGYEHTETRSLAKQKRNLMKTNVVFACSVLFFPTTLVSGKRKTSSQRPKENQAVWTIATLNKIIISPAVPCATHTQTHTPIHTHTHTHTHTHRHTTPQHNTTHTRRPPPFFERIRVAHTTRFFLAYFCLCLLIFAFAFLLI